MPKCPDERILIFPTTPSPQAYNQLKLLHKNAHNLLDLLLSFYNNYIPKSSSSPSHTSKILLDILYNETVTTEEAANIINNYSIELVDFLPEIFDMMPEIGVVGFKDLKVCFEVFGEKMVESEFLVNVFEEFNCVF